MCAGGAFSASEMCFCTYFTYYATCISDLFLKECVLKVLLYENESILTRICEAVAEYYYLSLDLSSIW